MQLNTIFAWVGYAAVALAGLLAADKLMSKHGRGLPVVSQIRVLLANLLK